MSQRGGQRGVTVEEGGPAKITQLWGRLAGLGSNRRRREVGSPGSMVKSEAGLLRGDQSKAVCQHRTLA